MAAIDRNILRLGAYEMLFCPDVPAKVAINEALELAKRYSTAQSSRFVNGILDRLQVAIEPPTTRPNRNRPNRSPGRDRAPPSEPRSGHVDDVVLTNSILKTARNDPPRCGRPPRPHDAFRRRLLSVRGRRRRGERRPGGAGDHRPRHALRPRRRPARGGAARRRAGRRRRADGRVRRAARSTSSATSSATTTRPSSPPRSPARRPAPGGSTRWSTGSGSRPGRGPGRPPAGLPPRDARPAAPGRLARPDRAGRRPPRGVRPLSSATTARPRSPSRGSPGPRRSPWSAARAGLPGSPIPPMISGKTACAHSSTAASGPSRSPGRASTQPARPALARLGRPARPRPDRRLRLPRPRPARPMDRRDHDPRTGPRTAPTGREPSRPVDDGCEFAVPYQSISPCQQSVSSFAQGYPWRSRTSWNASRRAWRRRPSCSTSALVRPQGRSVVPRRPGGPFDSGRRRRRGDDPDHRPGPRGLRRPDGRRGPPRVRQVGAEGPPGRSPAGDARRRAARPTVYLIAGVNGSGKTTSIAKLAQRLKDEGKTILLAACDTFRAAAADQLTIWAKRSGSDIVKGAPGADPASVAHDACDRALARRRRRPDRRYGRPPPHPVPPDARAGEDPQRRRPEDPRRPARGPARARRHQRPERHPPGRGLHQDRSAAPA